MDHRGPRRGPRLCKGSRRHRSIWKQLRYKRGPARRRSRVARAAQPAWERCQPASQHPEHSFPGRSAGYSRPASASLATGRTLSAAALDDLAMSAADGSAQEGLSPLAQLPSYGFWVGGSALSGRKLKSKTSFSALSRAPALPATFGMRRSTSSRCSGGRSTSGRRSPPYQPERHAPWQ